MKKKNLSLGIELGSTRIKTIIIDGSFQTIATGTYDWENELINGYWTYDLKEVWHGIQESIRDLNNVELLSSIQAVGVSAMMHGYLAFDSNKKLLTPFRTWRNSNTDDASRLLSDYLNFNIAHRWSLAHLYQAVIDKESHIDKIDYFTTLAGYVHWKLTNEKVLGIGDASGMFPIDADSQDYDQEKLKLTNQLLKKSDFKTQIQDLLPKCLVAGEQAGRLTSRGAMLLDPKGKIPYGIILAPPEGDAGTGMVATNSVKQKTGNVSAGTSVFAMIVLEERLKNVYSEIDIVTTPEGNLVSMVHVNNCTSDLNAWINLFEELLQRFGLEVSNDVLFDTLLNTALEADEKDGGLLTYGYLSGENITKVQEGRPLFMRLPDADFTLSNFMSSHLNSAFAALNIGMNILYDEGVSVEEVKAHGGIFKTKKVAQKVLSSALKSPVSLSETASEGGAWGMAILANYAFDNKSETLTNYLDSFVFVEEEVNTYIPTKEDIESYKVFMQYHKHGLEIQRIAAENFKR